MPFFRATPDNLAARIAAWVSDATTRANVLVFRSSTLSAEDVRARCWEAGVMATVATDDGDLYRVTFVDVIEG